MAGKSKDAKKKTGSKKKKNAVVTPKVAVKKTSSKKTKVKKKKSNATSTQREKIIKDAPVEQYFILCNGEPIKNVEELADVMEDLRDEVFNFHVTPDKNDFATWIHDVFKDIELAEELANIKHKEPMRLVLYKHIVKKIN